MKKKLQREKAELERVNRELRAALSGLKRALTEVHSRKFCYVRLLLNMIAAIYSCSYVQLLLSMAAPLCDCNVGTCLYFHTYVYL